MVAVAERSALRRTLRVIRPHLRPQTTLIAGGSLALILEAAFRVGVAVLIGRYPAHRVSQRGRITARVRF